MDDKTLDALRGSIAKWVAIRDGTGKDDGVKNCPLCAVFLPNLTRTPCNGCPVAERTGRISCCGSPYHAWDYLSSGPSVKTEADRALAQAELDFLRSLLPDGASE